MSFRSDTRTVHERARTNFTWAGKDLKKKTDNETIVFTVEFAVAEARIIDGRLANIGVY
jgi:hypothetical protein